MTLSISNLVAPLIAEPTTWLVGPVASTYKGGETLTVYSLKGLSQVDASGNSTTVPLGTSGPFVLKVDNEQILCSAADYTTNKITVYGSITGNGRGYGSTTIAAHQPGGYGSNQVSLVSTSVQGGVPSSGGTVTLTSGTASQNTTSTSQTWYVAITGATSGTVAVAIGATSSASTVIVPSTASNAVSSQVIPVNVPSGWWIKVTTTTATINASTVIINNAS